MPEIEIPELSAAFLFRRRPVAIPGDLRPAWRIGLVVQLLRKCCRGGRSTHTRLHVLSWGIRTKESRRGLQEAISGHLAPDSLIVRFEPLLNRAVDFAIGEDLVRRVGGGKIQLTGAGNALADELESTDAIYVVEKQFMDAIGQRVTEAFVTHIFGRRE